MLADFPGSFEKENPGDVSPSNPEPACQNSLKGVKWTSVFRETEFWFPGKLIRIMRYPDIPEHLCSSTSCVEGRGAGRQRPGDEPSTVPLSKLHETAHSRLEATTTRG